MKPGYLTTEFWMTIAVAIIGILVSTGVLPASLQDQAVAAVGGVVAIVFYIIGRSWVKARSAA